MTDHANDSEPIEIPPLTGIYAEPFSFSKLLRMMGFFGPAAVVASLSLGAGETIMVTGLGAWSEYNLLWLLLLSVLVKGVFVTYLCGRYTAVTGQRIGHRLMMLPGPRGWLLLVVAVAEVGLIRMGLTAVAKPCGNLITFLCYDSLPGNLSFGTWENLWTNIIFAAALSLGLLSSFCALQRQQIFICGVLVLGTITATLIVKPDVWSLLSGATSFGYMPTVPEWAPPAARHEYTLNLVTVTWTWSGVTFDVMTQISAFLTLSLGLFVVFSCVLYFNITLPPRYRPSRWVIAGGVVSAFILLLCGIGGVVGLTQKLISAS